MKKITLTITITCLLMSSVLAFAAPVEAKATAAQFKETPTQVPTKATKVDAINSQSQIEDTKVNLYSEPEITGQPIEKVELSQHLIPFYKKNGWIKVGDPHDGKVGWINMEQFQKAENAAFKQNMQLMYIEVNENGDKNGPKIVAYKNGQKLSDQEAKALYEKMQQRQQQFNQSLLRFQQNMMQQFNQDMNSVDSSFWMSPFMPMMQPIVIIEQAKKNNETKEIKNQSR